MPRPRTSCRRRSYRDLEEKDASLALEIVDREVSVVGLHRLAGDGEPEPEAGPVGAELHEGIEILSTVPGGRPPHSSSISNRARASMRRSRTITVPSRRLNLMALTIKLESADRKSRTSASSSIVSSSVARRI